MRNVRLQTNQGYITLISVLVVGAIGLSVATLLLTRGIGSTQTSDTVTRSVEAIALSNACVEEALEEIRESTSYTGSDTVMLGRGTCTYTVTSNGGQNRTIEATGTVGDVVRKTRATITIVNPQIVVSSWQSVADF